MIKLLSVCVLLATAWGSKWVPTWAVTTKVGSKVEEGARNQDRYLTVSVGPYRIFGIFDGHGVEEMSRGRLSGEVASELAAVHMREELKAALGRSRRRQGLRSIMNEIFSKVDDIINSTGGTTATLMVMDTTSSWVNFYYVGDSEAIVLSHASSSRRDHNFRSLHDRGRGYYVCTPVVHNVFNKHELRRLRRGGYNKYIGPDRIFLDTPEGPWGLAVTRSLGDRPWDIAGNISRPDVHELEDQNMDVGVLASDGLWDVMDHPEVASFIYAHRGTLQEKTRALVDVAALRWDEQFGRRDDITVLLVDLRA